MKSNTKTIGKRKSREPRTQMHLTMKNMFLNVIASRSVLGNDIIVVKKVLKFILMVVKDENDFEISEFYRSRTFGKVENLMIFFDFFSKVSKK